MPYRLEVFHDRECRDAVERLSLSAASDEVAERQAREIGWRCECAGESRVLVLSCRVDGEWVEVSRVGTRRYAATAMVVIDYYWTADGEPERCSVRAANLAGETCYHCARPIDGVGIVLDSEDGAAGASWETRRTAGGSRSIQTATSFRAIGSMTERAATSAARSPSRAVRLLSAAAAPQKEDSRASAHRPRPLFELQDLGSVRTNSTVVDFILTSILLPSGLSGLDGRALAL